MAYNLFNRSIIFSLLSILTCFYSTSLQASIAAGGLEFQKSKPIHIKRQDVTLSLDRVSTSYVYWNASALDVIETLVFSLPEVESTDQHQPNEQISQFHVTVNGRQIDYETETRPVSPQGVDLTKLLTKLNVPFEPTLAEKTLSIRASQTTLDQLAQNDLYDPITGRAKWITRTFYYWQQLFPAAMDVHVRQTYKPAFNQSKADVYQVEEAEKNIYEQIFDKIKRKTAAEKLRKQEVTYDLTIDAYSQHLKQYCPTKSDYETLIKSYDQTSGTLTNMYTKELSYVLTADNFWSGPREHFTLKIEHPSHMHPVMCWNLPFERKSSNLIVSEAENFLPLQDVNLLFIEKK